MSRVDVVIPCYNYAAYLKRCVISVLSQSGVEIRALIIDDCSPDNTAHVAATLVHDDPRVFYRRHDVNKGHIETYNEGLLEWASGDYALLLSADDLLAPGALRRASTILDEHSEVGLVHGWQRILDHGNGSVDTREIADPHPVCITSGTRFIEDCCTVGHNPVATPTAVVRTAVQREIGGYRKSLPHTGDMEMWLRFAARSSVAHVDALQAYKRIHQTNMQHQYLASALIELKQRLAAFDSFFRTEASRLADAESLRDTAVRSLAMQAFWAASRAFDQGNDEGCVESLAFASHLDPELQARPEWARLRWKRRLGKRGWRLLRPMVDRLRSRSAAAL